MKGKLLFAQSGGPSSVINASACGIIQRAMTNENVEGVLAGIYGIEGILSNNIADVSQYDMAEIEALKYTPASAFGSCRHKMPDWKQDATLYEQLVAVFKQHNIRFFVYIGGNDSMDTCNKIALYMQSINYTCSVIGVPKTVDNDLMFTDHCPGFGSSAKFVATMCHEIAIDTAVYKKGRITLVEVMGRHAGWLTAASALATVHGAGPDLIYMPEHPFDMDSMVADAKCILEKQGHCLVAVSEGIKYANGKYVSESTPTGNDAFAHSQLGGVAQYLANELSNNYNVPTRAIELSLPQRCAGHIASATDSREAYEAGAYGVDLVCSGLTNHMVSFNRTSNKPYNIQLEPMCLDNIANAVKYMPREFINDKGNNVTDKLIEYALPLIQGENQVPYENGLPRYSNITPHSK